MNLTKLARNPFRRSMGLCLLFCTIGLPYGAMLGQAETFLSMAGIGIAALVLLYRFGQDLTRCMAPSWSRYTTEFFVVLAAMMPYVVEKGAEHLFRDFIPALMLLITLIVVRLLSHDSPIWATEEELNEYTPRRHL